MNTDENDKPDGNAAACIDAGIGLAEIDGRITRIGDEAIPVALVPNGMSLRTLEDVLKISDARADKPRRLRGTATHQELGSFIAHVNAFKDGASAVFADATRVQLTAVLNYHIAAVGPKASDLDADERARWADHRSVYTCPLSEQWKRWTAANDKPMGQEEFAQFIEDNMVDLANPGVDDAEVFPKPAAVLEMARKLAINLTGEFKREINPTTGEYTFINRTEHGPNSTKIHKAFLLGIPVFEAGELYRVEARLRFTLAEGRPRFAYSLYQADAIKRDAFGEVRAQVAKETGLPVFAGSPES